MREDEAHMKRANEALEAARLSLAAGLNLDAASRAYYAMYHAAHGLLASVGESAKTHKGLLFRVRDGFGRALGPEALAALSRLQQLREESDYEAAFRLSGDEARDACETAERFVAQVASLLGPS